MRHMWKYVGVLLLVNLMWSCNDDWLIPHTWV